MKRGQAEFRLHCAVADLLRKCAKPAVYWTTIPNGEARSLVTGARLKRQGVRPGAPDILLIVNGQAIGLELKAGKGRQTDNQRDTEQDWTAAGGTYHVANGYDAAFSFLDAAGVLRTTKDQRVLPRERAVA